MATKLSLHPPVPIPLHGTGRTLTLTRFGRSFSSTRLAHPNSGLQQSDDCSSKSLSRSQLKSQLYQALQGVNRGIFGVASDKKSEIERVAKLLESQNPTPDPALNLDKVGGCWKLVYSSITILGSKRTKLGLRDFISLGEFLQIIDVAKC